MGGGCSCLRLHCLSFLCVDPPGSSDSTVPRNICWNSITLNYVAPAQPQPRISRGGQVSGSHAASQQTRAPAQWSLWVARAGPLWP